MNRFTQYIDQFGHISVTVEIGGWSNPDRKSTGATHYPANVAQFLRELASEIEVAGDAQ